MPATTTRTGRRPARKSPLRVVTELQPHTLDEPDTGLAAPRGGPGRAWPADPRRPLHRIHCDPGRDRRGVVSRC
jgi:hypothetical protein